LIVAPLIELKDSPFTSVTLETLHPSAYKMTADIPGVAFIVTQAKLEHPRVLIGLHSSVTFDATIRSHHAINGTRWIKCSLHYMVPDAADVLAGVYNVDAKVRDTLA
jgi:hypothetical protein